MVSTQDIRNKEIINIADGKSLGFVSDIELNIEKGRIEAIIVPVQRGFFGLFSKENEYVIKWKDIRKIGEDVILVEVPAFCDAQEFYDRDRYRFEGENQQE